MTYVGWLIYEKKDASLNASFIQMLIQTACEMDIQLDLKVLEQLPLEKIDTFPDFVWNRSRHYQIAQFFESRDIKVFNHHFVNKIANNKILAQYVAQELCIPNIPTWTTLPENATFPLVAKTTNGHGGKEVALCTNQQQVNTFSKQHGDNILFQPFIASNSQDVRIWTLGNQIIGAVKRTGHNSFKSNYTLGGSIEKFTVPPSLAQYVQTLTKHLQSDYIGVDFILGEDGNFYFNEIEDPVGARSYFQLYDIDLPQKLLQYIKNKVKTGM